MKDKNAALSTLITRLKKIKAFEVSLLIVSLVLLIFLASYGSIVDFIFPFWIFPFWIAGVLYTFYTFMHYLESEHETHFNTFYPQAVSITLIGIVYYVLIAPYLDLISFWTDEIHIVAMVQGSLATLYQFMGEHIFSPPLDPVFFYCWHKLVRLFYPPLDHDEILLRIPYFFYHLIGTISITIIVQSLLKDRVFSLILGLIYFTNRLLLDYSIEIRFYSLPAALCALQLLIFFVMLRKKIYSQRAWLFYLFIMSIGTFIHFFNCAASSFLLCLLIFFQGKDKGISSLKSVLPTIFIVCGLLVLCVQLCRGRIWERDPLNWLIVFNHFFDYYDEAIKTYYCSTSVVSPMMALLHNISPQIILLLVLYGVGFVFINDRRFQWLLIAFFALECLLPLLGVVTKAKNYFLHPRHILTFYPILFFNHVLPYVGAFFIATHQRIATHFRWAKIILFVGLFMLPLRNAVSFYAAVRTGDLESKVTWDLKRVYVYLKQDVSTETVIISPDVHQFGGVWEQRAWNRDFLQWMLIKPLYEKHFKLIEAHSDAAIKKALEQYPAAALLTSTREAKDYIEKGQLSYYRTVQFRQIKVVHHCSVMLNPSRKDGDGDGIVDSCDNCPSTPNGPELGTCISGSIGRYCTDDTDCGTGGRCGMNQENSDLDSRGNLCDADDDNDGIPDDTDTCPFDAENDYDSDGICGDIDNCSAYYNPDQEDSNKNGVGDACDEEHWVEAENADTIVGPIEIAHDENASGGKYIYSLSNTHPPVPLMATYRVKISHAGEYILWGRIKNLSDTRDNSFLVKLDRGLYRINHLWAIEPANYWYWDTLKDLGGTDPVKFNLRQGEHMIMVQLREDGTQLDTLLLTNNKSFVPAT